MALIGNNLALYKWPLGAKNVLDLTSKVRRLRCHLRRLRCHLRRLTLDVKSKTFFASNGHLYRARLFPIKAKTVKFYHDGIRQQATEKNNIMGKREKMFLTFILLESVQ